MPVPRSLQPFVHIIRGHPAVNNTGSFARDSLANEVRLSLVLAPHD